MTVHHFGAISVDTKNPRPSSAEYLRILISRTNDITEATRLRLILSEVNAELDRRHKKNITGT